MSWREFLAQVLDELVRRRPPVGIRTKLEMSDALFLPQAMALQIVSLHIKDDAYADPRMTAPMRMSSQISDDVDAGHVPCFYG